MLFEYMLMFEWHLIICLRSCLAILSGQSNNEVILQ